ncbi:NB-ARC domain-containing protein [Nocardia terpenica]|uniref:NB-ARC domain-containing protein n=1 Tax=Nocardia terpenica TaxID=455432 RepID=A0A6G9Z896_9NOCA|nr:NB-ARC domain-containing protein [Nocardia terpenica]QIS21674.1 hypothetical protein F6W96_28380 [Nocardia terpenica]
MREPVVRDLLQRPPLFFVDRDCERNGLVEAVDAALAAGRPAVTVLTGMPGVGKTMLAVRSAGELRGGADRGFEVVLALAMGESGHAPTAHDALAILLNALGVKDVPPTLEGRQSVFREETADRRTLLLLDDVENAEQIQALLPGSAASVVIATSRRRSDGFEYYRYVVMPVEPFDLAAAQELLTDGMDPAVARAYDTSLRELAGMCGYLPYALDIARARLRRHYRDDVAAYVDALRATESQLTEFKLDDKEPLTVLFEEAYRRLPDHAGTLYRLLGLHRGRQFGEQVAIALAGPDHPVPPSEDLRILVDWCLLTELPGGRFEMHTLTAQHARGLLAELHPADVDRARRRMVESYLEFVVAREMVISDRVRFGPLFHAGIEPAYSDAGAYERAQADLELERANLRGIITLAEDVCLDDLAWQLCEAMITFYFQRDLFDDEFAVHRRGLAAAQRLGEPYPLLVMHNALGRAYFGKRMHDEALEQFRQAGTLAGRLRGPAALFGLAQAAIWEAFVHQRFGDYSPAVEALSTARMLVADPDFPADQREREERLLDMNGCTMIAAVGRTEEALADARRAVRYFTDGKEQHNYAKSIANLGRVLSVSGAQYADEAVEVLTRAVELEVECELPFWEADSSEVLGNLLLRLGRDEEGRYWLARAAELNDRLFNGDSGNHGV